MIVDSARDHFVPVCIYNNTSGDDDARLLEKFDEPAWNNPVVRILDGNQRDLVDRIGEDWTLGALGSAMVQGLQEAGREAPPYLELLAAEETSRSRKVEQAVFGMG
jgi:hypothetical protein